MNNICSGCKRFAIGACKGTMSAFYTGCVDREQFTPGNIHAELLKVCGKNDIDHWYSDLYVRKTQATEKIISAYKFRNNVETFIDQIDHVTWYDIPFAYNPAADKEEA